MDPDRPRFHLAPAAGWLNDPNGPVFYRGRWHLCAGGRRVAGGGTSACSCSCQPPPFVPSFPRLPARSFFQHVERGSEWQWGLVWGHAVSSDLARWRRLPHALAPTPGGPDADGCWSGCCCGACRQGACGRDLLCSWPAPLPDPCRPPRCLVQWAPMARRSCSTPACGCAATTQRGRRRRPTKTWACCGWRASWRQYRRTQVRLCSDTSWLRPAAGRCSRQAGPAPSGTLHA